MTVKFKGNKFRIEQLEPRLLFSGSVEPVPFDGSTIFEDSAVDLSPLDTGLVLEADISRESDGTEHKLREIIFIDSGIDDYQQLLDDLSAKSDNSHQIDVILVESKRDGIRQISETLARYQDLDAVHVVSHGTDGAVQLGNTWLRQDNIDAYANAIEGWQDALTNKADLLFYGCDLAAGEEGQGLIDSITLLTGADVAASNNLTGHEAIGGDWVLEYEKGEIDVGIAVSNELQKIWDIRLSGAAPEGGYTAVNVIPQAQITQVEGAGGDIIITWKGIDAESNPVTLHSFQYSDDDGDTWYTPSNGDASNCFSNNWQDNGGAGWSTEPTFGAATAHSFTFRTAVGSVNSVHSLSGVDQSDIKVKFILNDGTSDSAFLISEAFRLDNESPTATITGGSYDASTDTLTITGTNFNTIAADSTDITSYVNWNNLTWDINNDRNSTANISFDGSGVSNLTVTNDTTLTLVFTGAKAAAIEANPDYGAAYGDDSLTVRKGFSYDYYGNKANTDGLDRGPLVITGNPVLTAPSPAITTTAPGPATVLDPLATVTDIDSLDFDSGMLTVSLSSGGDVNDELSILPGPGVRLTGFDVEVNDSGWITVGTWSGGTLGNDLIITWNANSTLLRTEQVLQQIAFMTTGTVNNTRIVTFVLTDGDGGTSNAVQQQVNFVAANQAPEITLPGPAVNFTEDDPTPVIIDPGTLVSDPDSPDFDTGTLTVSISANGTTNDTLSILPGVNVRLTGFDVEVDDGGWITVGTWSGGTLGTDLIINWNANSTLLRTEQVLQQIAFSNSSQDPSSSVREIDFILSDGDGGTSFTARQQVNVFSVNNAPAGTDKTVTTLEDTPYTFTSADFGFSDAAESHSFYSVKITTLPAAGTLTNNGLAVNAGDNIFVTDINLSHLVYTPAADANGALSFTFQVQDDGGTAIGGLDLDQSPNTMNIDVTPVGDTPQVANITTDEDTQSGAIVINRNTNDGAEVTHFRISNITNGTLYKSDGVTVINNGDYITFAEGQAGVKFTPSSNSNANGSFDVESSENGSTVAAQSGTATSTITVTPVGDTPQVANIITDEDTQSGAIVIDRNVNDGAEVTHFRISGITNGTLYKSDGVTVINNGDYITFAEGQAGVKFTPSSNSNANGSFDVESSENGSTVAAQSGTATSTITVTPVGDTPQVANITTDEDTQSGAIVINRNTNDGAEVTHFRISNNTNGTLYKSDGVTVINNGDYITFAEGQAGVKFTPSSNSNANGSFDVESSEDGSTVAAQSGTSTSTITVTAVNDAPVLDNSSDMILTTVIENDTNPAGNSVANIISSAGGNRITDADSGAFEGIAVIGVDDSNGTWEYFNGAWISFASQGVQNDGTTNDASALLLDPGALVRFVPNAGYTGSAGDITFRAWDQTSIEINYDAGVDTSGIKNGGSTAFSTATETATLTVISDNTIENLLPPDQSTDEDTDLIFSTTNGNSIVVYDGSPTDEIMRTTLSVTTGTLKLATTNNLFFENGADESANMTIRGLESDINAALDGLKFSPANNYNGTANLQVSSEYVGQLEGHYTFDSPAPRGADSSPNGNDAVLVSNPSRIYHNATRGDVLVFNGVNDYVQVNGMFGNPTSVTLAAWVKLAPSSNSDDIISLGDHVVLRVNESGGNGIQGFFWDGGGWQITQSGITIDNSLWHHLAYTINDATGEQTLYLDGGVIASDTYGGSIDYTGLGSHTYLGRNGNSGTHFFDGRMDDARIYSRALSSDEISMMYQDNLSHSDNVTITVTPIGDTPQVANITTDEDTQSGAIVIDRHANDGAEVSHFRISNISNGTLYKSDGVTQINNGDYITFAEAQAGVKFTPSSNSNANGSFDVESSEDGSTVAAQSGTATSTITVTPVGDTPQVANITTNEDTQSGAIVIDRNTNDGVEVTHFRISGITNGTLYKSDGVTQINNGDYITFAEAQAGVKFTPSSNSNANGSFDVESSEDGSTVAAQSGTATSTITVTPVGDTPQVANITTNEDTQSGAIVIDRHANDGAEVTHFRISGITNGMLYKADGITAISNGDYITFAEAQAGVKFKPNLNSNANGSFDVESSDDGSTVAAQSAKAPSTITVTPVGDTPQVADITTDEETQSGAIVINRNTNDGAEVTHFRISNITNGTLYKSDGVTVINNGDYITFAEAQAGVKFTPPSNSNLNGSFDVESSENGSTVAAQSGVATSTITVTPVGDTPQVANITTDEDTQSGAIVIDRHANDGAEVTHFRISNIANGTLYKSDGISVINNGDYITFAEAQAGVKFTPSSNSNANGSFDVESSENGSTVAAQSGVATSTITVTPVGDTPQVANITTDEDTQSGAIVIDRHANDGAEVTHFRISNIANGTLYKSDGISVINNGDYITFAEAQAGVKFTPSSNANGSFDVESSEDGSTVAAQSGIATSTITVTPVGDTPQVANITTDEDTQSGAIIIDRNASDGAEVTHFRISNITNGTLYKSDGVTVINNGDYITFAEAQAGVKFTPSSNSNANGSFDVESSENGSTVAAQSGVATSTITVTPVGDTPQVANITTDEDTQSGAIVIDRHANDGAEVTHFRISNIANGTLYKSDGISVINNGDYITFAEAQAGVKFTPSSNSNANGSFDVESSENGSTVAAQSGVATSTITVTPVGDTPQVANITTDEDTQSGAIVIDRHANDGAEVTHFRISNIANGTLYKSDGISVINNGDYITFAEAQAGVKFTPSSNANGSFDVESSEDGSTVAAQSGIATSTITVTPVGDTPQVANITTDEDTQSGAIIIDRNASDGAEVTHFRISNITNGTLYKSDGVTVINNGDYITFAEAQAGVKFTPSSNSNANGSFDVESSENGSTVAAQSGVATSTITITPVGDTPQVANIITDEDTQSGTIVIDRNANDGTEVTNFRISNITNGTLYKSDGVTVINNGNYITFAEAQAGIMFTPSPNSNANGSFDVESSEDGSTVAAQSNSATSTITITPVGDTPQVANITTPAGTQSGLIIIERNADDGAEVTHFRISNIANGFLYLADGVTQINNGDFISFAQGQAGLRFMPSAGSGANGSFDVESSEDGVSVSAQSGVATSNITVLFTADAPSDDGDPDPEPEETEEPVDETPSEDPGVLPNDNTPDKEHDPITNKITTPSKAGGDPAGSGPVSAHAANSEPGPFMERSGGSQKIQNLPESIMAGMEQIFERSFNDNSYFIKTYEHLRKALDDIKEDADIAGRLQKAVAGSAIVTTTGLSVGYVVWLIRGGMLISSVLSSMPAWQIADPLPVLAGTKNDDDDDESLESIIKKGSETKKEESKTDE